MKTEDLDQEEKTVKNKNEEIYKYICTIIISFCVAIIITVNATCYYFKSQISTNPNLQKAIITSDDKTIEAISDSLKSFKKIIDEYYLGNIDSEKVLNETIKGYVKGLGDKYTEYYTKDEWKEFEEEALGNYKGIGIYMSQNVEDNIVVTSVIKGSPAEEAGIKAEDIISSIDDQDFLGKKTEEAAKLIKGKEGDKVKLGIIRGKEHLEFEVERREIKIYHVESEVIDGEIGYILLQTFNEGCGNEFKRAIEDLQKDGIKKYIIDLRYNTGGFVDEALKIATLFIEKDKVLLYTEDSKKNRTENKAEVDPIALDSEIVILVNEYTASASEILTGALKDYGRATVVGEKTYGKGVMQNVFSLVDGSVLKLTFAEYFTPNNTKINEIGITPDYVETIEKGSTVDTQLEKAKELLKK